MFAATLILKGFDLLFVKEPTHIPSVLDVFILRPDSFLETSRRLKKACTESLSDRTAVVSSAYWRSIVSSLPIEIPFIAVFCQIAIVRVSTTTTNE